MKKYCFLFILVCILLLNGCFGDGYSKSNDPEIYLSYELLENGTYRINGFSTKPVRNLVIPSYIKGIKVTSIAESAFEVKQVIGLRPKDIESVVIEEGIKIIDNYAFKNCGATSYKLSDSIEIIGESAFSDNCERTINLPKNIKEIGNYAFSSVTFLSELYLDKVLLGEGVFYRSNVRKVTFSDYYTEIPNRLFCEVSSLEEVVIPDTCTKIGDEAFKSTNIKNIVFCENLSYFGDRAFFGSRLESIVFNAEYINMNYSSFGDLDRLNTITFNNTKLIDNVSQAFNSTNFKEIYLNDVENYCIVNKGLCEGTKLLLAPNNFDNFEGISIISSYAMAGRDYSNLTIPNDVTVDSNAFNGSKIENLILYSSNVNTKAFYYTTINKMAISTKVIRKDVFYNVSDLKVIEFLEGVETIQTEAFVCLHELETIYLPASLKQIKTAGFIQCSRLKNVYYNLKQGDPADLYAGSFVQYISNVLTETGQINATINSDLKIYVNADIYDKCLKSWNKMPIGEHYIYHDNLINHIELYE